MFPKATKVDPFKIGRHFHPQTVGWTLLPLFLLGPWSAKFWLFYKFFNAFKHVFNISSGFLILRRVHLIFGLAIAGNKSSSWLILNIWWKLWTLFYENYLYFLHFNIVSWSLLTLWSPFMNARVQGPQVKKFNIVKRTGNYNNSSHVLTAFSVLGTMLIAQPYNHAYFCTYSPLALTVSAGSMIIVIESAGLILEENQQCWDKENFLFLLLLRWWTLSQHNGVTRQKVKGQCLKYKYVLNKQNHPKGPPWYVVQNSRGSHRT